MHYVAQARSHQECGALLDVLFALRAEQRSRQNALFDPFHRHGTGKPAEPQETQNERVQRQDPSKTRGINTSSNVFAKYRRGGNSAPRALPRAVRRKKGHGSDIQTTAKPMSHQRQQRSTHLRCMVPHRRTPLTTFIELASKKNCRKIGSLPSVVFVGCIDSPSTTRVRETHNTADIIDRLFQ